MVIYDDLQSVPYEVVRKGGTVYVYNVPPEMAQVGLGMGAYRDTGELLLALDQDGNEVLIPAILVTLAPFIWFVIKAVVVVVFVVAITTAVGGLVYAVKAVPEGEVKAVLEDGTRVWQSSDGSTWLLHPDGTPEKIGGSTYEKMSTLIIVIVVAIVSVVLIWRFAKGKKKPPPEKE